MEEVMEKMRNCLLSAERTHLISGYTLIPDYEWVELLTAMGKINNKKAPD